VCIFSANCTLCRLMHSFEKECTNLPPDDVTMTFGAEVLC
jgi:hypothetical protein